MDTGHIYMVMEVCTGMALSLTSRFSTAELDRREVRHKNMKRIERTCNLIEWLHPSVPPFNCPLDLLRQILLDRAILFFLILQLQNERSGSRP
jgi:hypothetical protein